jgi:hypothetical protein
MHFISATGIVGEVFRRTCKPIGTYQHEKGKKSNALDGMCLVFFLNNQPDALIIQMYSVKKSLLVSGIFSAHHQEFSTVHSALVSFMQVFDDRFQAESRCSFCMKFTSLKYTVENS